VKIAFRKMHGAGNDFVVIDDRDERLPLDEPDRLSRLANRPTGIGCEGILVLRRSAAGGVRMLFFNPDGRPAAMCGNGARCLARFARDVGAADGAAMVIDTGAGAVKACVTPEDVTLWLPPPQVLGRQEILDVGGIPVPYVFAHTGVPHAVIYADDVTDEDPIRNLAAAIRSHTRFMPEGTNVNFVKVTGAAQINVRTFERGVEGETFACGTGVTASAIVAARDGRVRAPVSATVASGDVLTVDFQLTDKGAEGVTLTGPAVYVFDGSIEL
jgi:diaminopimelate epimerase